jgi:hypothetical protein
MALGPPWRPFTHWWHTRTAHAVRACSLAGTGALAALAVADVRTLYRLHRITLALAPTRHVASRAPWAASSRPRADAGHSPPETAVPTRGWAAFRDANPHG